MNGLVIREPWITLIFNGEKTWEIRGSDTKKRGKIALIRSGSGLIIGTVHIVGSRRLTEIEYRRSIKYHMILDTTRFPYPKTHAWIMENPEMFSNPIPYIHPHGAVIWVNLDHIEIPA